MLMNTLRKWFHQIKKNRPCRNGYRAKNGTVWNLPKAAGSVGDSNIQEANRPCIDNVIERSASYK